MKEELDEQEGDTFFIKNIIRFIKKSRTLKYDEEPNY
jgi:hypothetical protein